MTSEDSTRGRSPSFDGGFATTHWSVVIQAGCLDSPDALPALEKLCQAYWYPLYAFVRRSGYGIEDAQDLTQDFFARLIANEHLAAVHSAKGRFRWFLLTAIKRLLINDRVRKMAAKRGGGSLHVPFDGERAEDRFRLEAAHHLAPDRLFDRAWATTLIAAAHRSLAEECVLEGKEALFQELEVSLVGDPIGQTYAELGERLGMTEGAVKVTVHRLRRRFRDLLREQVSQTVTDSESLEEELRDLLAAFSD